jgi:hypothetical protein
MLRLATLEGISLYSLPHVVQMQLRLSMAGVHMDMGLTASVGAEEEAGTGDEGQQAAGGAEQGQPQQQGQHARVPGRAKLVWLGRSAFFIKKSVFLAISSLVVDFIKPTSILPRNGFKSKIKAIYG